MTKPCSKQWLLSYKLLLSLKKVIHPRHSLLGMNVCLQVLGGWPGHPGPGRGTLVLKAERQQWLFPGLWRAMPCFCGGSLLLGSFLYLLFDDRKRVLRVWIRKRLNAWSPQPDLCSDHCWLPGPCHLCGRPAGERACIPPWRWPARAFISEERTVLVPGLWREVNQRVRFRRHPFLPPRVCSVPCIHLPYSAQKHQVPLLLSTLQPGLDLHAERGLGLMRPSGPSPDLLHPQIQGARKSAGIKSACRWCIRKLTCHLLGTLLTSQQREAYFARKWEECPVLTTSLSLMHGPPHGSIHTVLEELWSPRFVSKIGADFNLWFLCFLIYWGRKKKILSLFWPIQQIFH